MVGKSCRLQPKSYIPSTIMVCFRKSFLSYSGLNLQVVQQEAKPKDPVLEMRLQAMLQEMQNDMQEQTSESTEVQKETPSAS